MLKYSLPNLKLENVLWQRGYRNVVGLDESGRGALAGPITAAGVIFKPFSLIPPVFDSKGLTSSERTKLAVQIKACAYWSVAHVDNDFITQEGIVKATHKVFLAVIVNLPLVPDMVLVDGFHIRRSLFSQQAIIKGDRLIASIAAASIIAKVERDRILIELDKLVPGYQFAKHKGYGTSLHRQMLVSLGKSCWHRPTFLKGILSGSTRSW